MRHVGQPSDGVYLCIYYICVLYPSSLQVYNFLNSCSLERESVVWNINRQSLWMEIIWESIKTPPKRHQDGEQYETGHVGPAETARLHCHQLLQSQVLYLVINILGKILVNNHMIWN